MEWLDKIRAKQPKTYIVVKEGDDKRSINTMCDIEALDTLNNIYKQQVVDTLMVAINHLLPENMIVEVRTLDKTTNIPEPPSNK